MRRNLGEREQVLHYQRPNISTHPHLLRIIWHLLQCSHQHGPTEEAMVYLYHSAGPCDWACGELQEETKRISDTSRGVKTKHQQPAERHRPHLLNVHQSLHHLPLRPLNNRTGCRTGRPANLEGERADERGPLL